MSEISNNDNFIDGRDVATRIEELESERDDYQEDNELDDYPGWETAEEDSLWYKWDLSEEGFELHQLEDFAEGYWTDIGEATSIIRDTYFEEYAEDFAYGIGEVERESSIAFYICWESYADDMKSDYSELDFDGVAYQAR